MKNLKEYLNEGFFKNVGADPLEPIRKYFESNYIDFIKNCRVIDKMQAAHDLMNDIKKLQDGTKFTFHNNMKNYYIKKVNEDYCMYKSVYMNASDSKTSRFVKKRIYNIAHDIIIDMFQYRHAGWTDYEELNIF